MRKQNLKKLFNLVNYKPIIQFWEKHKVSRQKPVNSDFPMQKPDSPPSFWGKIQNPTDQNIILLSCVLIWIFLFFLFFSVVYFLFIF